VNGALAERAVPRRADKEQQHKEQQHKEQQHKEQQHKEQQHKEQWHKALYSLELYSLVAALRCFMAGEGACLGRSARLSRPASAGLAATPFPNHRPGP